MFKKTFTVILVLLISACASKTQTPILLAPTAKVAKDLFNVSKVEINDIRAAQALAYINGTPMPINNQLLPSLEKWLAKSIDTNPFGNKTLSINLLSYASYIKQESLSFNIESVLEWQVKVESENKTWTKSYQSTINEKGPLKADNSIIEKHLNKLATTLLDRSLADAEFKDAVK